MPISDRSTMKPWRANFSLPQATLLRPLAEVTCASNAEFVEKLRYLLAHETRIFDGPPDGNHDFGSILVAVDRHFKSASTRPIGERGVESENA
jgi:hypothetical protein